MTTRKIVAKQGFTLAHAQLDVVGYWLTLTGPDGQEYIFGPYPHDHQTVLSLCEAGLEVIDNRRHAQHN